MVLAAYNRHVVNAVYLKKTIETDHGIHVNHDRIHEVLKMSGFVTPFRRGGYAGSWSSEAHLIPSQPPCRASVSSLLSITRLGFATVTWHEGAFESLSYTG